MSDANWPILEDELSLTIDEWSRRTGVGIDKSIRDKIAVGLRISLERNVQDANTGQIRDAAIAFLDFSEPRLIEHMRGVSFSLDETRRDFCHKYPNFFPFCPYP